MTSKKSVTVVVGTRPEIIKMAPVIRELRSHYGFDFELIYINQQYDVELSSVFFENLQFSEPNYNLGIESGTQGNRQEGL